MVFDQGQFNDVFVFARQDRHVEVLGDKAEQLRFPGGVDQGQKTFDRDVVSGLGFRGIGLQHVLGDLVPEPCAHQPGDRDPVLAALLESLGDGAADPR